MANELKNALAMHLLLDAVAQHKKGKAGVAVRLGCCRTLLSRILSPNDNTPISEALSQKIIDTYHLTPDCPAIQEPIPRSECERIANGPAPMHNPTAMARWKICQTCPHKPVKEVKT